MQAIELLFSHQVVSNSVTPWTVARQAPLFTGFPWQEYWSGLSFPSPGDLPNPEIKPMSPALAGGFFTTTEPPGKPMPQNRYAINTWVMTETFSFDWFASLFSKTTF